MEISNFGQLIQHLAKKAGIDASNEHLINVLSNAELTKVPIHSELVAGIDNNLLSLSQATDNHPDIKRKYHAQAMNAFDARMAAVMSEAGLSEDKIDELNAEKSTYKRFELLTAALKENAATKSAGQSGEEKSALQKQVDDMLAQMKATKKAAEDQVAQIQNERKQDRVRFELKSLLSTVETVFDELPPSAKQAALDSIINKALQDKEASFDFDDADTFILKGKDDTAVVGANQTKYTPQLFVDEILAQNKVLKVSKPKEATPQPNNNGNRPTVIDASNTALTGNNQTTANLNRANREAALKNMQPAQA